MKARPSPLWCIEEVPCIGKAINHKSVGDVVVVEVPAGVLELEILSIERDGN